MEKYKCLLFVPIAMLIISAGFLCYNYSVTGEWFARSIEMKGGTTVTLDLDTPVDTEAIKSSPYFESLKVQQLRSFSGYKLQVSAPSDADTDVLLEELSALGLPTDSPTIQSFGPAIGSAFWAQAQMGIIAAFIMMGIIVFAIFRVPVPSFAVMLCAVSDIIVTLAVMQVAGLELSLAGLAALLMLIGYSIDTDILLTTRVLKGAGKVSDRVRSAFGTGVTMTGTTLGALLALMIVNMSPVLTQIAQVLVIGLAIDVVNTWLQNSVLIRWYAERRGHA